MTPASFAVRSAAALAALILAAAPAWAQGTAEERSACMGDAFKFCSADIPDVPKIETCLEQHKAGLTPACRAEFDTHKTSKMRPEHFN